MCQKQTCENCEYCQIIHDKDLFTKAKCMATSKNGRTMTYHATFCYSIGEQLDPVSYCQDQIKRRKSPTWCPKNKERR